MLYHELLPHFLLQSGRRGSNPLPSAWKADALPDELLPLLPRFYKAWREMDLNHRRLAPTGLQPVSFDRSDIPP